MTHVSKLITSGTIDRTAQQIVGELSLQSYTPTAQRREIQRPCETAWQREHLRLDCFDTSVQRMATAGETFMARWYRRSDCDRLLVLAGHTGCGKTHTLRALRRFADKARVLAAEQGFWKFPPSVWFAYWPVLAREISEAASPMSSIITDCAEADLLLLDDVGSESDKYKTGETIDALCQLLSRRAGRWTIITTNISPAAWPTRFDIRVADRLHRGSRVIDLSKAGSYAMR